MNKEDRPLKLVVPQSEAEHLEGCTDDKCVGCCELVALKAEANLGLASTKELLDELKTRFEVPLADHHGSVWAADMCHDMAEYLRPETLAYRTVDSGS